MQYCRNAFLQLAHYNAITVVYNQKYLEERLIDDRCQYMFRPTQCNNLYQRCILYIVKRANN